MAVDSDKTGVEVANEEDFWLLVTTAEKDGDLDGELDGDLAAVMGESKKKFLAVKSNTVFLLARWPPLAGGAAIRVAWVAGASAGASGKAGGAAAGAESCC